MSIGLAASLSLVGVGILTPTRAEVIQNISVPVTFSRFVPCANDGVGEVVQVGGDHHILASITIASSGNVHARIHLQPQGFSGFGLTTGDKYQATGVVQDEFTLESTGQEETFIVNIRLIGQGPGNNLTLHETLHFTINANGDLTAALDHIDIDCK
jgi:hypothetical protein